MTNVTQELIASKSLTAMQQAFIKEMVAGRDKNDAGLAAGYAAEHVNTIVWHLLQQPQIIVAIQIGVARDLAIGAAVANRVLQDFARDEKLDKRLRVVCAKTILDRAGHIAPKAAAAGQAGDVPLNEMSMTDLRALADKLEGEIAGRAKVVPAPSSASHKAQAIEDIL